MIDTVFEAARSTVQGLLPIAALFIALGIAMKREAVFEALRRARHEITTNIGLLLINALIVLPLITVPILAVHALLPRDATLGAFWDGLPGGVPVLVAVLAIDFAAYWRHRAEHSKTLWPIHATHHADEAMNWLSLRRKHPLGQAFSSLLDTIPALALGLPIWTIGVALLVRSSWGYLAHADVPWTLGPVGKVLISPAAHRLHHIRDEKLMGANYGNTVTMWDQLFGTYVDPAPYINCETGIEEGTRGLMGELARPFEARYWRRAKPEAAQQEVA
jgi:sterol desaturase/sphingolipid hydroxylase (fatty acid hydroxylase superfamily)